MMKSEINIRVHLYAGLDKAVADYDLRQGKQLQLPPRTSVKELLSLLNIPYQAISLVVVNGKRQPLSTRLENNDIIDVFPPVGGG